MPKADLVTLGLVLLLLALYAAGCSSGPQIPVQGTPVTIQIEAQVTCGGEVPVTELTAPSEHTQGPQPSGACSLSVWVDSPATSNQRTQGIETGEVGVDAAANVSLPTGGT